MATERRQSDDDDVEAFTATPPQYSHCDSYYVNRTKFTYFSVYDGLTDTIIVNLIVFVVSVITYLPASSVVPSRVKFVVYYLSTDIVSVNNFVC